MEVRKFLKGYMLDNIQVVELHKKDKDVETIDKGIMSKSFCFAKYRYKKVSSNTTALMTKNINNKPVIEPIAKIYVKMWKDE